MISNKATAYGRELSPAPEFLICTWSKDNSGWWIVKYEANFTTLAHFDSGKVLGSRFVLVSRQDWQSF